MNSNKAILIILDGWGIAKDSSRSAIDQAKTPTYDHLIESSPNATLVTYGGDVGLPNGQMGNSEVGHINIGAGRVVYQELAKINKSIADKEMHEHPVLIDAISQANMNGGDVHLMGLLSDGGVHSHIEHLKALVDIVSTRAKGSKYIHAFTDGRDTAPDGGRDYVKEIQEYIGDRDVKIASIIGRYYAMDRDLRWERTKEAYDLLVNGKGKYFDSTDAVFMHEYEEEITDEFIRPSRLCKGSEGVIKKDDLVVFFNFRTDRPRQLTTVLTQQDLPEHEMSTVDIDMITFTVYDEKYEGVKAMYLKDQIKNGLGESLASQGRTQLRMAETEKYPHVTFFLNGGREEPFEGESRIVVPSPKVATYDLMPEMSARELTERLINEVKSSEPDFICINFANTDMVGHTGDFDAAVKATEFVDGCLERILKVTVPAGYQHIIIADHGNSDIMVNEDGSPHTAHTTNLVPIIYVGEEAKQYSISSGKLADVAPTVLNLMDLPVPEEMSGDNLINKIKK